MEKLKLTNMLNVAMFNQDEYLQNQKQIFEYMQNIVGSFDYDNDLEFAKEYLDNLNSDIFLNNSKVKIFVLFLNKTAVSFAILCNDKLDLLWTHFDYLKLGYATILVRAICVMLYRLNQFKFKVEADEENLIFTSLLNSFKKVSGIEFVENNKKNGKKTIIFDIKNIKIDEFLLNIQKFAI